MWVVTRNKVNFIGYRAFVELSRQSWIGRVFSAPLSWKPSRIFGDFVYAALSSKRKLCSMARPVPLAPPRKVWRVIGSIVCGISLYSVIVMNIGVVSCGRSWQPFFRAWPISAVDLVRERKWNLFEENAPETARSGWIGKNFTAPRRPAVCDRGNQFPFLE